jgi:ribonuclease-3
VPALSHNERLEFLGDSILWASIGSLLYIHYPHRSEAQMTLYKIALVREENLAKVAREINLWQYIMLSHGEEKQWWKDKDAILSDTLEALLWAQYIIHGFEEVQQFIEKYIRPELTTLMETDCKSYKSLIQERSQSLWLPIPSYETIETKKEKEVIFQANIFVGNELLWTWYGKNKKKAQEAAAQEAYNNKNKINKT